jgi:hypothetical protein
LIEVEGRLPAIWKRSARTRRKSGCGAVQRRGGFLGVAVKPYTNVATIDDYPVAAGGFIDRGNDLAIAWSILGRVPECFVGWSGVPQVHHGHAVQMD